MIGVGGAMVDKQCEATKHVYDHKAAQAEKTPEEREKIMLTVLEQTRDAERDGVVDCAGEFKDAETGEICRCSKRLMLIWMYRCWFCGKWLCPRCAKAHFGER